MMNDKLKDFSDAELLLELIERNGNSEAPKRVHYAYHHERSIIGIGDDESADIVLSGDALRELKESHGIDE